MASNDSSRGGRVRTPEIDTRISGRTLVYSSIVCFLAWVFSVYDYTLFGTLLPVMSKDFGWSTSFATFIVTIVGVGTFFVALLVGPLLDYLGRKPALVVSTVGAAISSGLTALTPAGLAGLYLSVVRTFSGLGYSEQAVNATYLNEMYGNHPRRGFIYSLVQGGWPIGVLLGAALSAVLLPAIGWRHTFLVATFPAIVIAVLAVKLRESPKFQAMKRVREMEKSGRHAEAVEFGRGFDIDVHHTEESTFKQLFEPDIRKHTIFISLAMLCNWIGIQVFAVLGTTVLTQGKGVAFSSSLIVLVVSNAAAYIGYLCHGFVGDRIGRRLTIAGGWVISGLAYTLMLFGPNSSGFVLTMYTVGLFFIIGPYAALLFFMGESFPTRVRGTGASFVNAMGPIGAIVGSGLFSLFTGIGVGVTTTAFLAGAIATLVSGFLMLGTRDVKSSRQDGVVGEASTASRVK